MAQVIWFELNRWKAVLLFFLILIFCILNVSLYQGLRGRFESVSDSQAHADAMHKVRARQILYRNYISKYTVIDDSNSNSNNNNNNKETQTGRRVRIKHPSFDPALPNLGISVGDGIKVVHRELTNPNPNFAIDPYLKNNGHGLALSIIMANGSRAGGRLVKNRYLYHGPWASTIDKDLPLNPLVIPGLTGCIIQDFPVDFFKKSASSISLSETALATKNLEVDTKLQKKKPTAKIEIDLVPDCLKPLKKKVQVQKAQPARFLVDSQWNLFRIRIPNFSHFNFNDSANFLDGNVKVNENVNIKVIENKNESENQINNVKVNQGDDKDFWKENVCYYRTFEKNPASKLKHDNFLSQFNNKKSFRYGPMIKIVQDKTPLPKSAGFIETFCHSNGWMPKTVYEKYWTRVLPNPELEFEYSRQSQENQKQKLQDEKPEDKVKSESPGLNILIIGLASLSRANFIREMPLSFSYLMNNLSATEFLGFNTLDTVGSGSNAMATNIIPILTGLNYKEFRKNWPRIVNEVNEVNEVNPKKTHRIIKKDAANELDFEKGALIWSKMAERGYLTSFSEDFIKAPCSSLSSSSSSSSFKFLTRLPPDNSISFKKYPRLLHETIPDYLLEKNPLTLDFTVMANHLSRYLEDKFNAAECDCKEKKEKLEQKQSLMKKNQNSKNEHEDKSPFKTSTAKPSKLTVKSARIVKAKKNAICWGYRLAFDVLMENLLETMKSFSETSESEKGQNQNQEQSSRFWHMTWSSSLTRRAPSKYAKYGDKTLYETLKELKEKGMLENTALLLLSDHGGSFVDNSQKSAESAKGAKSARSKSGQNQYDEAFTSNSDQVKEKKLKFLESRRPMLYLALPKTIEKDPKYEMALKTLKLNAAHRLVTPFDLYPTLLDLTDLKRISEEEIIQRVTESVQKKLKQNLNQNQKNPGEIDEAKLSRSSSLFLPISKQRSCADVEINPVLCTCANLRRVNIDLHVDRDKKSRKIAKLRSNTNLNSNAELKLNQEQGQNLEKRREDSNLNSDTNTDPVLIKKMAHKVIQWINQRIRPYKKCHQLTLRKINQAQILQSQSSVVPLSIASPLNKTGKENSDSSKYRDGAKLYELDIETAPRGNFYASLYYNPNVKSNTNDESRNTKVGDHLESPAIHIHILDVIRLERKSVGDATKEIFNLVTSDTECVATLNIQHLCICKKSQGGNTRMKMRRSGDFLETIIHQILPN